MPPKKKQQEIDLSTLPQCITSNAIILCRGKKERSDKILAKIYNDYKSFFSKITRQQVLDHAKEKNIYVDPNTLNDKQKKDPKFMQTICTELTPEVITKATKSLIEQLSIKVRLQLKAQNQKPQQERAKPILQKKMDQVFVLSPEFCQSRQQYESLANIKQGIKYILVINPSISWVNAPQIPISQPDQQQQPQQQQDEQVKQLKQLQQKQQLTQSDIDNNVSVDKKIQQIRQFRRQSSLDSSFRDCIIDFVECEVDPYNQEQSLNDIVRNFINRLSKLNVEYGEFLEWKKQRTTVGIVDSKEGEQKAQQQNKSQPPSKVNLTGNSPIQLLSSFVDSLFSSSDQLQHEDDDIQNLINQFDFNQPITKQQPSEQTPQRKQKKSIFYNQNESVSLPLQVKQLEQQTRSKLKYPGLNRYLMPDIPLKSAPLRKLERSQYAQFLREDLPYEELDRRLSLLKFQQILKQTDEDRKYSFLDRVYQQNHDEKSLMRELYRALSLYEDAHFLTRYNEENDKLYLVLMYKNNQRRVHKKLWESQWKVLPNYQSWLKYFRENDTNLNTQSFYDIDYEKIGHINQQVSAFSVPDGGVIISKKSTIANATNEFLYGIKNHHLFGLSGNIFYSENGQNRVSHFAVGQSQNNNQQYETQVLCGENITIRLKQTTGDIVVQVQGEQKRIHTADGYTIVYDDKQCQNYKILHPTGGISSPNSYTNQKGFGMKNNIIHNIPTLLRRTEAESYQIIKRDDNTVIINDNQQKWIKFYEGTQYLIKDHQISIEKKNYPFVKCQDKRIQLEINDLIVTGEPSEEGGYSFVVEYKDGNKLKINGPRVQVTQLLSTIPYIANITTRSFNIQFQQQSLNISPQSIQYTKNGVKYNPNQSEQNYTQSSQQQSLPKDHIQPKLFIISPDNSGVEFLSQKQLQYYFALKSNPKHNTISSITNNNQKHTQNVYIISKFVDEQQMNPKRIKLNMNIDLDVFKSEKYFSQKSLSEKFTVRSLIKHKNLLPQDQTQIQEIKDKKDQWVRKQKKEENQFGHKVKGDPIIDQLNNNKKIMIDFRKKELYGVDFDQLKDEAIQQWKLKEKQHMTMVAKQQEQDKIRMKLSKRKKSYVQDYPQLVINQKQKSQQQQNYSPAGFYTHYFQTSQGRQALAGMPEWVFRPKTAKVPRSLDPQLVSELNNTMNKTKQQQQQNDDNENQQQKERYDTVDVNLKPVREIYIKPSVFTKREIDQEREAFESEKKAYYYHQKKRKQFNVYGNQRKQKVQVNSMMRTQPISQINQKYLITEAPLDKRIKISSMKNKLTSHATSMTEMRKEGPHQSLLKTIDKRNDYNTLLEKRTMMVHADLNDKLQRDILITPVEAEFGYLKEGRSYQIKINIKNQDILAQRLVVKKARNINVKVMLNEMGPIALGMSRKVIVQIKASPQFMGRFSDEFEIVSKHEVYKIPITAHILNESQFQNEAVILLPNVREIPDFTKRKLSSLPPIN